MTRPLPSALLLAAGLVLAAGSAAAQSWGYERHDRSWGYSNAAPSAFDWRSQLDRPGDYRCDRFWDANRTDCDAAWRDQRRGGHGSWNGGYGYQGSGYRPYGYDHGGYSYGYGPYGGAPYAHAAGSTTYEGAYGRPDHVFPGGGYGGGYGGAYGGSYNGARDPRRIDWCRYAYRSYDPQSGYYRAYSGRLVFCG